MVAMQMPNLCNSQKLFIPPHVLAAGGIGISCSSMPNAMKIGEPYGIWDRAMERVGRKIDKGRKDRRMQSE